jgi:UV DNA damage endonuclease
MSLGLCCQWVEEKTAPRTGLVKRENVVGERSLQLGAYKAGKYSDEYIIELYKENIDSHIRLIRKLKDNNIRSFRISSGLLPLFEFCRNLAENTPEVTCRLQALGSLFRSAGIRVTTHPGQFVVLSSDRDTVIESSIRELEYHAWVFDQMGLSRTPYNAINIHGGKGDRLSRLIDTCKSLPDSVRSRLTLENDEKCYNTGELLKVHEATGIPVVFDSHHHGFNTGGLNPEDASRIASNTWGDIKPLQHLSNSPDGSEGGSFNDRRAHSDYIYHIPEYQLKAIREDTVDVDIEAKAKNLAIFKLRQDFGVELCEKKLVNVS